MNDQSLINYISGQSSEEENKLVKEWIAEDASREHELSRLKNIWIIAGINNEIDPVKKEKAIQQILSKINTINKPSFVKTKWLFQRWVRYAAVFLLAFIIGGLSLYFTSNDLFQPEIAYNEIIVPPGQHSEIILADNTHVWLNSGAKLKYPSSFSGKNREVELSGEAYFEVTKNKKKPFQVITPEITVNVLGTCFNVEAFHDSKFVNVVLVEGKVNLESKTGKILAVLAPSELASLDIESSKMNISTINTRQYISWKEGIIYFKDERLEDIVKKMENWYNINVLFEQDGIKDIKVTGSIMKNKPVNQILDILKYTSEIDYSINIRSNQPNIVHLKRKPM